MRGTISFHPVDPSFFDRLILPLLAGDRVNPESFLERAVRLQQSSQESRRYIRALEAVLKTLEHEGPDPGANLWQSLRTRMDGLAHRPAESARKVAATIEPDLHLHGRPFFITEGSPERVAQIVEEYEDATTPEAGGSLALEQLVRIDPGLARSIKPLDEGEAHGGMYYRNDLLAALKWIYELAGAARAGDNWGPAGGPRKPAIEVLSAELPWKAVALHARSRPFWVADDVDGLETIRRAAGLPAPEFLIPAARLFVDALDALPALVLPAHVELRNPKDVGAFVPPSEVPALLDFLNVHGSRIIQAATRHGEGPACRVLLRKIKECVTYAARHDLGYVEASGIEAN